jgi:hypothetical protein
MGKDFEEHKAVFESKNRTFGEGTANRNPEEGKLDYEGFFNPLVLEAYAKYMHKNRYLADGTIRDSDNWQKLFGENHVAVCTKSLLRHTMEVWKYNRGCTTDIEEALGGVLFNAMAIWLSIIKKDLDNDVLIDSPIEREG